MQNCNGRNLPSLHDLTAHWSWQFPKRVGHARTLRQHFVVSHYLFLIKHSDISTDR